MLGYSTNRPNTGPWGMLDDDPRGFRKSKSLGARVMRHSIKLVVLVLLMVAAFGWLHTHKHKKALTESLDSTLQHLNSAHAQKGNLQREVSDYQMRLRSKDKELEAMRNRLDRLTKELGNTHNKHSEVSGKLEQDLSKCQGDLATANHRVNDLQRVADDHWHQKDDVQRKLDSETHLRIQQEQQHLAEIATLRAELARCRAAQPVGNVATQVPPAQTWQQQQQQQPHDPHQQWQSQGVQQPGAHQQQPHDAHWAQPTQDPHQQVQDQQQPHDAHWQEQQLHHEQGLVDPNAHPQNATQQPHDSQWEQQQQQQAHDAHWQEQQAHDAHWQEQQAHDAHWQEQQAHDAHWQEQQAHDAHWQEQQAHDAHWQEQQAHDAHWQEQQAHDAHWQEQHAHDANWQEQQQAQQQVHDAHWEEQQQQQAHDAHWEQQQHQQAQAQVQDPHQQAHDAHLDANQHPDPNQQHQQEQVLPEQQQQHQQDQPHLDQQQQQQMGLGADVHHRMREARFRRNAANKHRLSQLEQALGHDHWDYAHEGGIEQHPERHY